MRRSQENTKSITPKNSPLEQIYGTSNPKSNSKTVVPTKPKLKQSQSSIVAASKAAYAEKYGPINPKPPPTTTVKQRISTKPINGQKITTSSSLIAKGKKSSTIGTGVPSDGSGDKKNPISNPHASKSTNKVPIMSIPHQTTNKAKVVEPDYDDDFEEDYQSDFEEVQSTDEDDLEKTSVPVVQQQPSHSKPKIETTLKAEPIQRAPEASHRPTNIDKSNGVKITNGTKTEATHQPDSEDDLEDSDPDDHMEVVPPQRPQSHLTQTGFFSKSNPIPIPEENNNGNSGGQKLSQIQDGNKIQSQPKSDTESLRWNSKQQAQDKGQKNSQMSVISSPSKMARTPSKSGFDFAGSQLELQNQARLVRARQLLKMIKLNTIQGTTLHLDSSEEQYMYSLSGTRRKHQNIQTDDDKSEEYVQTEKIEMSTKWTQRPPTWSTTKTKCDIKVLRQEALGVGTENVPCKITKPSRTGTEEEIEQLEAELELDTSNDWDQIASFIFRASRKVLYVLESNKRLAFPEAKKSGDGGPLEIKMSRGLAVFSKLEMSCLACEGDLLACANGHSPDAKKHTSKNVISVWSMKEPSNPIYFLRVWGQVTTIHIYILGHIVAAGHKDGTISLWDLDERTDHHTQYQDQVIRTPSIITSRLENTHFEQIVGLSILPETDDMSKILSLDQSGNLITWSIIRTKGDVPVPDPTFAEHTSAWARLNLSYRSVIKLFDILKEPVSVTSFLAWTDTESATSSEFAIGTINGYSARGILKDDDDKNLTLRKYCETGDNDSEVTCFDISLSIDILLAGSRDKKCRMYEFSKRKLLLVLDCESVPVSVKWSKRRSSLFYIAFGNSIALWDLVVSDMKPWKTIKIPNIQDFAIYSSFNKEFTVVLASNELKISLLAGEIRTLTEKDSRKLESFLSLLLST